MRPGHVQQRLGAALRAPALTRARKARAAFALTDAECTVACVSAHGAPYVLYDGKEVYTLSNQRTPEKFAAQKVTVIGTVDAKTKTIQVDSMASATFAMRSTYYR